MAGSWTKQADWQSAKYLNDIIDTVSGGTQLTSVPGSIPYSGGSATQPGDRIILDDAGALAKSDTVVGTLYGGIFEYVSVLTTTRAAVRGGLAFWVASQNGISYQVSSDAQPSVTLPGLFAGVFINAPATTNYVWIQIGGTASVLFDSAVTATTPGNMVSAKVSATVASTADNGAVVSQATVAALIGVSLNTVTASTISQVQITRFPGRI